MGWRSEGEIAGLVDYYLHHEVERKEIANAGQELTLQDFTFQRCRDKMLTAFQQNANQFSAPARNWAIEDVSLVYLEYYYRYQLIGATLDEFSVLKNASRRAFWNGLPMLLKTLQHSVKRALF